MHRRRPHSSIRRGISCSRLDTRALDPVSPSWVADASPRPTNCSPRLARNPSIGLFPSSCKKKINFIFTICNSEERCCGLHARRTHGSYPKIKIARNRTTHGQQTNLLVEDKYLNYFHSGRRKMQQEEFRRALLFSYVTFALLLTQGMYVCCDRFCVAWFTKRNPFFFLIISPLHLPSQVGGTNYRPVVLLHGLLGDAATLDGVVSWIQADFPGT